MVLLNPPLLVRTARVAEVEVRLPINVSLKLLHIGELRAVVRQNDREQLMERKWDIWCGSGRAALFS